MGSYNLNLMMTRLSCIFLPVLLLGNIKNSFQFAQTSPETTSIQEVVDFLTDDLTIKRFYVILTLQFSFLGLGWLVAHEMWRFINPSTDTDLSLTSLSDFLLDDQTGLTGATINAGYGIATTLGFLVLSQLGNPSTVTERREGHAPRSQDERQISVVEDVLPSLLSRTGSLTQILINAMLYVSF